MQQALARGEIRLTETQVTRSGPVPEAAEMAAFKAVQDDLPGRIMAMAERALELEGETLKRAHRLQFTERMVGRCFGLAYALIALAVTMLLAANGHAAVALAVAGATAAGIVAALVTGKTP